MTHPDIPSISADVLVVNCPRAGPKATPDAEALTARNGVARGTLAIACLADHQDAMLRVASAACVQRWRRVCFGECSNGERGPTKWPWFGADSLYFS